MCRQGRSQRHRRAGGDAAAGRPDARRDRAIQLVQNDFEAKVKAEERKLSNGIQGRQNQLSINLENKRMAQGIIEKVTEQKNKFEKP